MEILDFLNKNAGALNVIFTGVVTLATAVYAGLTYTLVRETRLMRKVQTEPKIEITVRSFETAIHLLKLHIRNIGLGPAVNVKFSPRVIAGGEAATALLTEFTQTKFFQTGLAYFGPGQEFASGFTQMTQGLEAKLASVIAFDVEYQSTTGQYYKETVCIDMSEHKGSYQLGKPHLYAIAQSLDALQKDIGNLASGYRRVGANVYSATDREQEAENFKISTGRAGAKPRRLLKRRHNVHTSY